jgi:vitamin B12 transporter
VSFKNTLLLISSFFSAIAFAEAPSYKLEPVVVTATRTLQSLEQNIAPVIVISTQEIEQSQAKDVADLLRLHAGLEMGRNGGPGQASSVFIRGTDSDHVLLMIDGVKVNPGTIGGPTWQFISPHMVERIEIVKGPRSSLYGSEAIGGVVNIITKKAVQGHQWHAAAEFGAQSSKKYIGSYHGKQNAIRLGINGEWFATDGFPPRVTQEFSGAYKNTSVDGYFGYTAKNFDLELATWQARGNTQYVGLDENFSEIPKDQDFKNNTTSLTVKYRLNNWNQTLKLSNIVNNIRQNQISRTIDFTNFSLIESWDFSNTTRNTLDWQNDIKIGNHHLLTAGLYLSKENTASMSFGTDYDENTLNNAVYAQDISKIGSHQIVIAGRLTDHEDFGTEGSYNIDYGWSLNRSLNLLAGIGKGFRAPNASERFGFAGNPNLKPETSQNIEFGLKYKFKKSHYGSISLFQNEIKNLIKYFDADGFFGPQPGQMENIGRARIRGVELSYNYQLQAFSFYLEGVFQNPQDRDNKQLLLRRAKRNFTGRFSYNRNSTTSGIEALYSSSREDIDDLGDRVELPSYGVVNLFMTNKLDDNWGLSLKVDNLFDKEYQLVYGYNTQGLLALIQIRYASQLM